MKYCPSCGEGLKREVNFCPECGASLGEDDSGNIVVNVQQSADHASSTAASGGKGNATASAETTDGQASTKTNKSKKDEYTKEDYLGSFVLMGVSVGLIGGLLSVSFAGPGTTWLELLTTFPFGLPFWILGLVAVTVVSYLAIGFKKAPSATKPR